MSNEVKIQISPQTFTLHYNTACDNDDGNHLDSTQNSSMGSSLNNGRDRAAITITNTSLTVPIVFRLLTTDKNNFAVSPREGILQPGASITTMVTYTGKGSRREERPHLTEACFKVEYRGLLGEEDKKAVEAIAKGELTSTSLTDLLKASSASSASSSSAADKAAAECRKKKSTLLNCKINVIVEKGKVGGGASSSAVASSSGSPSKPAKGAAGKKVVVVDGDVTKVLEAGGGKRKQSGGEANSSSSSALLIGGAVVAALAVVAVAVVVGLRKRRA